MRLGKRFFLEAGKFFAQSLLGVGDYRVRQIIFCDSLLSLIKDRHAVAQVSAVSLAPFYRFRRS